ncbi:hypothetical protein RAH57_03570 [Chryseobacterium sp. CKR4-1]|uniref:hypothetical protein n=1 Tax=Chryseobacterium sp. CKR4-1 TaxID=3068896 RepID=UPI0027965E65|nr:hypothetical protein [Chryseobacterium sp. CKR4-1]MDQ1803050.1 hypothetical protein [Chryseobacterium sp. CKR4-1]
MDHNTGHVFNGSHLGKQFSANVFHKLFSGKNINENLKIDLLASQKAPLSNTKYLKEDLHPLFDFMVNTGSIISDWGLWIHCY